jgi:hypothetical protein
MDRAVGAVNGYTDVVRNGAAYYFGMLVYPDRYATTPRRGVPHPLRDDTRSLPCPLRATYCAAPAPRVLRAPPTP